MISMAGQNDRAFLPVLLGQGMWAAQEVRDLRQSKAALYSLGISQRSDRQRLPAHCTPVS